MIPVPPEEDGQGQILEMNQAGGDQRELKDKRRKRRVLQAEARKQSRSWLKARTGQGGTESEAEQQGFGREDRIRTMKVLRPRWEPSQEVMGREEFQLSPSIWLLEGHICYQIISDRSWEKHHGDIAVEELAAIWTRQKLHGQENRWA